MYNKLLLILFVSLFSLGLSCAGDDQKAFKTYKISGKILITNNCSNNLADIPAKIYIEQDLSFVRAGVRDENFLKNNIATAAVAGAANKKDASYNFSLTTRNKAKEWTLDRITTSTFGDICTTINSCAQNQQCLDQATRTLVTAATDNDANPTEVVNDFNITCVCRNLVGGKTEF